MNRRGFALMASIWLMVAIASVALEVSWLARTRRLALLNTIERDQAWGAANAALEHARARLSRQLAVPADPRSTMFPDPWRNAAYASDTVRMGDTRYVFSLTDDGATLDVNLASVGDLQRLFAACGADDAVASRLARRVADWRDADTFPRPTGAERPDYLAAGARELPRDGPVERVGELGDVLGMPEAVWQRASPLLSVHGIGSVNVNAAPREILLSLPGMTEVAADAILTARRDGASIASFQEFTDRMPPSARSGVVQAAPELLRRLSFASFAVRVRGDAWVDGSPVHVRSEALMVQGGGTVFVQWRSLR